MEIQASQPSAEDIVDAWSAFQSQTVSENKTCPRMWESKKSMDAGL